MENPRAYGKIMENLRVYRNYGKIIENPRVYEKPWKNHGKSKSLWKNHGKSWKI